MRCDFIAGLVAFMAIVTKEAQSQRFCLPLFKKLATGCYHFSDSLHDDWWTARDYCRKVGGFLAAPKTPEEAKAISDEAKRLCLSTTWLGGHKKGDGKHWIWESTSKSIRYLPWAPYLKQNYMDTQECLVINMNEGSGWTEEYCEQNAHVVCQQKPVSANCFKGKKKRTKPKSLRWRDALTHSTKNYPKYNCPPRFVRFLNGCYYYSKELHVNWNDAEQYCRLVNAKLTEMKNEEEEIIVRQFFASMNPSKEAYLGGTDVAQEGKWLWSGSGTKVNLIYWYSNNPDNYNNKEHCLSIYPSGIQNYEYNDIPCDTEFSFMCTLNM